MLVIEATASVLVALSYIVVSVSTNVLSLNQTQALAHKL